MLEGEYGLAAAPAARTLQAPEGAPAGQADAAFMLGRKGAPTDQAVGREERGGEWKQEPPEYF